MTVEKKRKTSCEKSAYELLNLVVRIDSQRLINLNAEIQHHAFETSVSEQQLHST